MAGTSSSHTVCQMPEAGVYVSPPGLSIAEIRCLPLGCAPRSAGSKTWTSSSSSPLAARATAPLTSAVKPSKPPVWFATSSPLAYTVACQSTASKWRRVRAPAAGGATLTSSRYHIAST